MTMPSAPGRLSDHRVGPSQARHSGLPPSAVGHQHGSAREPGWWRLGVFAEGLSLPPLGVLVLASRTHPDLAGEWCADTSAAAPTDPIVRVRREGLALRAMPRSDEDAADAAWQKSRQLYTRGIRFHALPRQTIDQLKTAKAIGIAGCTSVDRMVAALADIVAIQATFGISADRAVVIEHQFRMFPEQRRDRNVMGHCALTLRAEARFLSGGNRNRSRKVS